MWVSFFRLIANVLLIPLIKDGLVYLGKKSKDWYSNYKRKQETKAKIKKHEETGSADDFYNLP